MKSYLAFVSAAMFALQSITVHGVPLTTASQFSGSDPVITFESGSTGLPGVPGVQFSGGAASFYWPSPSPPGFGAQYFGNLNGATYLDIYFDQPQQAIGAYLIGADPFNGVSGVIQVAYDQSNNIIEIEPQLGATWGKAPVFLGIGEPTAQIYRVEWRNIAGGYFGVDGVIYGGAIGLDQMPNIPTRLTAQRQGLQVILSWLPADRATSYNVKRGNASGGPYVTVGDGVVGTTYTDTTVTNGGVYFYVVTAANTYGESAVSQQAIAFVVDHFLFSPIASPQTSSVAIAVTISACDSDGVVLSNFSGAVLLNGAGDHGGVPLTPASTPPFLNGQWTGSVTLNPQYADTNVRLTASSNFVSGTSNPFRALPPSPIQLFNLTAADLAYSSFTRLLYASIPGNGGDYSNSLVVIDPNLGRVVDAYYLGHDPSALSVSSDGKFLYIGFSSAAVFDRFNLVSNLVDLEVQLGAASGVAAIPGFPRSVAVTGGGIAIYDDGVQRSNIYPLGTFVVPGSANDLFTMGGGYPTAPFTRLAVDETGITNSTLESGIVGVYEKVKYQAGLIFTTGGTVFNPYAVGIRGHLTNCAFVEPDIPAGRIFSVGSQPVFAQPDAWTLYAWDATNLRVVGTLSIPGVSGGGGGPVALIRWGTNGLALSYWSGYQNQVFLIRTSLVPEPQPVLVRGHHQAGGAFLLTFAGDQSDPYAIWASTNLANWTRLGPPDLTSNGWFWFSDSNSSNYPNRYYRVGVSQ